MHWLMFQIAVGIFGEKEVTGYMRERRVIGSSSGTRSKVMPELFSTLASLWKGCTTGKLSYLFLSKTISVNPS